VTFLPDVSKDIEKSKEEGTEAKRMVDAAEPRGRSAGRKLLVFLSAPFANTADPDSPLFYVVAASNG